MFTRRSPLARWLCQAMAVLLLLSGMPRGKCCCTHGEGGERSCCDSAAVERPKLAPGICQCDPTGGCDCHHELDGPPDLPPQDAGSDRGLQAICAPIPIPASVAVVPPPPTRVGTIQGTAQGRAGPPPLFLVNCAFRC